jgi:dipeptidyl-peptidase-4
MTAHRAFGFPTLSLMVSILLVSTQYVAAQGTREDYEQSRTYASRTRNQVFRDSVEPNWFGDQNSRFWYRAETGAKSHQFVLVDAISGERREALDHNRLAELLSKATHTSVEPSRLQLRSLTFSSDASSCHFQHGDKAWSFELPAGPLTLATTEMASSSLSGLKAEERIRRSRHGGQPTKIRFENRLDETLRFFWVMPEGGLRPYGTVAAGEAEELSTYDGHAWVLKNDQGDSIAAFVASKSNEAAVIDSATVQPERYRGRGRFQGRPNRTVSPDAVWRVAFENDNVVVVNTDTENRIVATDDGAPEDSYGGRVWWSPDSMNFVVMKTKPGLRRTVELVDSSPDQSIHSRLVTIPYAKPGDRVDHPRPVLFSQASGWAPQLIEDSTFDNPYALRDLAWHDDSGSFSFLYNQRGHQCLRLISVNAQTAAARTIIDETSDTFVCYSSKTYLHRIDSTNELIWMSERSGWNHLYLIDAKKGRSAESKHLRPMGCARSRTCRIRSKAE